MYQYEDKMKKLLSNSILFTISNVLLQALSFLMLPLYSNIISTSEYGIISTVNTIVFFGNLIISLRLDGAVSRFIFNCRTEEEEKELFTKLNTFLFFLSSAGYAVFAGMAAWVCRSMEKYILTAFLIAALTKYLDNFYSMLLSYLTAKQKAGVVSSISLISGAMNLAATYLCVVNMENKTVAYLFSFLLISIFRMFLFAFYAKRLYFHVGSFKDIGSYLKYSVNFLPVELSYWIINTSDRVVITAMVGASAAGIYSMGSNFGHIVNIFIDSVNKAYVPFIFSQLGKKEDLKTAELVGRVNQFFVSGSVLIASGVFVFVSSVITLFNRDYAGSAQIAMALSVSMLFYGIMQSYNAICNYYMECMPKKARVITGCALLNVVLNIWFVHLFGAIGAAYATIISYVLIAWGLKRIANGKYRLQPNYRARISVYVLSVMYGMSAFLPTDFKGLLARIALSVVYVLLMVHFNVSLKTIWNVFQKKRMQKG